MSANDPSKKLPKTVVMVEMSAIVRLSSVTKTFKNSNLDIQ